MATGRISCPLLHLSKAHGRRFHGPKRVPAGAVKLAQYSCCQMSVLIFFLFFYRLVLLTALVREASFLLWTVADVEPHNWLRKCWQLMAAKKGRAIFLGGMDVVACSFPIQQWKAPYYLMWSVLIRSRGIINNNFKKGYKF